MFRLKGSILITLVVVVGILLIPVRADEEKAKCCPSGHGQLKTPGIAISLPEQYNTPDGMALYKGNILLSIPNVNNQEYIGTVLKIDKNDATRIWKHF